MVTTTRALPLSSQSRLQSSPNIHTTHSYLSRARTAAVRDMSLVMHEIDESEGDDNPPHVKRTRRVFPRPTFKESFICVCGEMLWCSELVRVCTWSNDRRSSICFATTSFKNRYVSGFIIRIVYPILPV